MMDKPKAEPSPDYWQDTVTCWHRLPNKWFFFGLLAAWLAVFQFFGNSTLGYDPTHSLFLWLYHIYTNPRPDATDSHGILIPFLVIGLFWWKRKQLLAQPLQLWWPGILWLAFGGLLHVTGFILQQPKISLVGLIVGLFGLTGLAWGRAWLKTGLFPFWLFIFAVPFTGWLLPLTFPLRLLSSWLTAGAANLLTIPVVRMGTQLMSPDGSYQYDVAAACSGIRSLVAIFLLATIYGFVVFRAPWKRGLLMALALPLSVLGNFMRLMCIILAAEFGGQSAGNYVHEGGPWGIISLVPYVPAILGLILAGRWLAEKKPASEPDHSNPKPETTTT